MVFKHVISDESVFDNWHNLLMSFINVHKFIKSKFTQVTNNTKFAFTNCLTANFVLLIILEKNKEVKN